MQGGGHFGEIFRAPGASAFVVFPMSGSTTYAAISGLTNVTGTWMAWGSTAGPKAQGNPGFRNLSGAISEIAATGLYTLALASTELPAASPFVVLRFASVTTSFGIPIATTYLFINTASVYADVTGINHANIAAPVTPGYMPIDIDQPISLSAPTDNSIEKALARTYMASPFATVSTVSGAVWDEVILSAHTTDNTTGKLAGRLYFATQYLDAAVSAGVSPPSAATIASAVWNEVITSGHSTDNTSGLMAARLYHATQYLDAAVTSRLAPTTAGRTLDVDTAGGTEIGSFQAGAITSGAFAAGAIDAAALAANAIGASEFAQDAAQEIADEVLNRNLVGGGSGSTYNIRNAFRRLRNRVQITGGNMLVYDETDTATAYAMSVDTAAGNPITQVDPIN